jgi:hypothetical protein
MRIWFRRNSVVHGGYFLHPNEVILSATNAIVEYKGAMETDTPFLEFDVLGFSHGISLWRPPPSGTFKANWMLPFTLRGVNWGLGVLYMTLRVLFLLRVLIQ